MENLISLTFLIIVLVLVSMPKTVEIAFAQTEISLQDTESNFTSDIDNNNEESNDNTEESNDNTATASSNSGLEQMTMKAQLNKGTDIPLADYGIKNFRFSVSDGSEVCPSNNCEYRVEDGQVSDYLGSGYVFEGKLKVTVPGEEDDSSSSKLYNFRFDLEKTGEEESEGQTIQMFEGRYGYGSQLTYDIPNATLQEGKNPVLTLHGERTPSENFTNQDTNVEVIE